MSLRSIWERLEEKAVQITQRMQDHFEARTRRHILLTQKYCKRLEAAFRELSGLVEQGQHHDASKFAEPELTPYVWLTWRYKCKDDGVELALPPGMEARIVAATEHHILTNSHHPEAHGMQRDHLINTQDRDKPPAQMIDATRMGLLDMAEMCADWCAVSEERGNTPREWADKNVGVRWAFAPRQRDFIYAMIDVAWGR